MSDARAEQLGRDRVLSRLLKTSLAIVAGVAVGLLGTGGTYAYLSASANAGAATTITAGTASLTVSAPAALVNFYPGAVKTTSFTVSNTGQVPLAVSAASVTSSNAAAALTAGIAAGDCGDSPVSAAMGTTLAVVQPGGSAPLCLVVAMPLEAPAGAAAKSTEITVTLNGVQQ